MAPLQVRVTLVCVLVLSAWQGGLDHSGDDGNFSSSGARTSERHPANAFGSGPRFAHAAKLPPLDVHPLYTVNGTTKRHDFNENDLPISLTSAELVAGETSGGAPLVKAVVRLTNPVDTPLEYLDVTESYRSWLMSYLPVHTTSEEHIEYERKRVGPGIDVVAATASAADPQKWRGRVFTMVDLHAGTLTFQAPLFRGESTLDSNDCPTTHALRDALRNVTYVHTSKNPDPATRGVEIIVTDVEGVESAPASTLIDIHPINDPPRLDLNGFHQPGSDITVVFGERERRLGVMLTSAAVEVGDEDGELLSKCFVKFNPYGDMSNVNFPDGDVERVTAIVEGSSVSSNWNQATFTLELIGVDTLDTYRKILASTRYTHSGLLKEVPNRSPPTKDMQFTEGVRTFKITIEDTHGATANATVLVNVLDVKRIGDPARDSNQATPAECSGYGLTKLTIARQNAAYLNANDDETDDVDVTDSSIPLYDPEGCVCEPAYEGDFCEIHPCGEKYKGTLVSYDAANDLKSCLCVEFFTGRTCDVECFNNGKFIMAETEEGGFDGLPGTAGIVIPEGELGACICDKGFTGNICQIECPGCDGPNANCILEKFVDNSTDTDTDYVDHTTLCVCSNDYMGEFCDIPCPCAGFGLAFGTCAVDEDKVATGLFENSELGKCVCDEMHTGEDCSVPCPPCTEEQGDCAPPVGYEKGVGEIIKVIYEDITSYASPQERRDAIEAAKVDGKCFCREEVNALDGWGYYGDDCAVACKPCVHGVCGPGGVCVCHPGFTGTTCNLECNGRGVLAFPVFFDDATGHRRIDFDRLPGIAGNDTTANSGLFDAKHLYGMVRDDIDVFELGKTGLLAGGGSITTVYDPTSPTYEALDSYCACGMRRIDPTDPFNSELVQTVPEYNSAGGTGFTGVFCDVPCTRCDFNTGACVWDGVAESAKCVCDAATQNTARSASSLVPIDERGVGYAGDACDIPCVPCRNGVCGRETGVHGLCVCDPGFSDPACAIECGSPSSTVAWSSVIFENYAARLAVLREEEAKALSLEQGGGSGDDSSYQETEDDYEFNVLPPEEDEPEYQTIGSRGYVNLTGALLGQGLAGTTSVCICDIGWTGPTCSSACPFPWDEEHGVCAVKDSSDSDYGDPWTAEIVCRQGRTGLPGALSVGLPGKFLLPTSALSKGRDCAVPCKTCIHGTCQDDGTCVCEYGALWLGPLSSETTDKFTEDTGMTLKSPIYPYPTQREFGYSEYDSEYHGCVALHPCSGNGELFNATCGVGGSGFVDNHTEWVAANFSAGGGWGCAGELVEVEVYGSGEQIDDYVASALDQTTTRKKYVCVDPVTKKSAPELYKFAMAYARYDPSTKGFLRESFDLIGHDVPGLVQGGYCAVESGVDGEKIAQPLVGGFCLCDSLRTGRFRHPSARYRPNGAYDYHFQGWSGDSCEIPCAPCSANGLCDKDTGKCVCHPGWNGYQCLTPCEPCVHGTCQYDGTCLCNGVRRAVEGQYALRLTRDPFFLEKGNHEYKVQGVTRNRYVHASYATTAEVEDYVWELEYECPNRVECFNRASDATHLPTRPNETYFRYTSPDVLEVDRVNAELARVRATRDGLITDVETIPDSMELDPICDEVNDRNEVTKGACLELMRAKTFGRTLDGCGTDWDSVRPWLCDDVVKAHFVNERNRKLGVVEVQYLRLQQSTEAENVWFNNNVNERQRLINAMSRGLFNSTISDFNTLRKPDYYMIWIVHQLIHGVVSGDVEAAYTGWQCDVPCASCDLNHGTCNYDGSCECSDGWYGDRCDRRCDCYRHVAVKNALELRDLLDDIELETVTSFSGYSIRPHGTCRRDGTCACYMDEDGTQWTGADCFTKCLPCNNGECSTTDGSCLCFDGWIGETCATPTFTECLPCNDDHGTCLGDGTCKCDKEYTGLDCSIECSPCVHGDCRLDGSCHCRPGWTLLDCSKFIDVEKGIVTRSDFALGPEGWRVHNNSCLGSLDYVDGEVKGLFDVLDSLGVGAERATDREFYDGYRDAEGYTGGNNSETYDGDSADTSSSPSVRQQIAGTVYQHAAVRGDCHDDGDGGDAGLEWDGSSGYLYLTDKLPNDDASKGELAFFRAPGKFLGDVFADAYDGTLSYELYLAGGGDALRNAGATPSTPHPPGSPEADTPDVYLIGGAPRVGLEIPPWDAWSKTRVVEWSRDRFPELKLDARWAKARVVATVEAYLDAPQVVLGIKAPRRRYYPPEVCVEEHCALNFAFDLSENGGWLNYPTVPAGFGWSDIRVSENLPSQATGGDAGNLKRDPSSYTVETTEYIGEIYPGSEPYDPFSAFDDLESLIASSMYTDINTPLLDGFTAPDPRLSWDNRADGGTANAVGDSSGGKVKKYDDNAKRKWDLYPEVYDAIRANRMTRDGVKASFSEIAWCLSSLTEILIRADYHGSKNQATNDRGFVRNLGSSNRATGTGETVRLDHVIIARKDKELTPSKWIANEHAKFLQYANTYANEYKVMYLVDYFTVNAEILRISICHGNGVYIDGDADNGCACYVGFVGDECEGTCPQCSPIGTVGGEDFSDGITGGCVLDDDPSSASLSYLESIGALEEIKGGAPTKCVCKEGYAGLLCDQLCLQCAGGVDECVTDPTTGDPACVCPSGKGGAYCQHYCPPCDYLHSKCDATTFLGDYPGTHAFCKCTNDDFRTGVTCQLRCPGDLSTNYCGDGKCTNTLEGTPYDDTTASMRATAFSYCKCDLGFVGSTCHLPCPGSASHPMRPGPYPCLGRGNCDIGVGGEAACTCIRGYAGDMCDTPRQICGDGVLNSNEECDDGNNVISDGCDEFCLVEDGWSCERVQVEDVVRVDGVQISYVSQCKPDVE